METCGLLLLYNNSEDARFIHEFIGTINHSWLTNQSARIDLVILVFKAIHGLAPPYISDLIAVKAKSSYNLRSNSSLLLKPPKEKILSTLGARSFYAAARNSLPAELRDIRSLCSFKRKLKMMRRFATIIDLNQLRIRTRQDKLGINHKQEI